MTNPAIVENGEGKNRSVIAMAYVIVLSNKTKRKNTDQKIN